MSVRSRTALALGLAGLATAGLGAGVLPAAGAARTFQVTLTDGRVLTLSVEVAPGTDPWDIAFPGVAPERIRAIAEAPPGADAPPPAEPPPAVLVPPAPPAEVEAAPRPDEPEVREGGAPQRTTGSARRSDSASSERSRRATSTPATPPARTDPGISMATLGAAPMGVPNFFIDKFRIPPFLLSIYQAAGIEYGIRWEVLAAINEIETDYGRNLNVSSAGALGWMQFMPATWKQYGLDANGDKRKDPFNPVDAIFAAARYLKAAGAETDLRRAVFAYNHADWYVDSVLMRARLIGGLPSNLVGSLTGLTQGMFPVHADARYTDGNRRGTTIHARTGAPVLAVQDGRIVRMGATRRLGRFVRLRDVYGNTYTYAHLGSVADRRAVVERRTAAPVVRRERLYAHPGRPNAWRAGGRRQVGGTPAAGRRLTVGSRVAGGTILGRVGSSHLLFEIRPAGRGAPRIDPKPILDGWKLLESTAIYRAKGKNPFFGPDARTPTIGQILLMGKSELETRVAENPRIELYGCGERDVKGGRIDRRVLATLEFLAASGMRPTVTSLQCGHSVYTASGNVSHHSSGNAVDIAKINGTPVIGNQGKGSITDLAVRRLLTLQGTMKPQQIITLMDYEGTDNTMAMADHDDHIHVGFQPMLGTNSRLGRQLNAVLKPGQWIKLIDRLGEIDNPALRPVKRP